MNIGSMNLGVNIVQEKSCSVLKEEQQQTSFNETYNEVTQKKEEQKNEVEAPKQQVHSLIKSIHAIVEKDEEGSNEEGIISIKELDSEDEELLQLICSSLQLPLETVEKVLEQINLEASNLLESSSFSSFIEVLLDETGKNILQLESSEVKKISELYESIKQIGEQQLVIGLPEVEPLHKTLTNTKEKSENQKSTSMSLVTPLTVKEEESRALDSVIRGVEGDKEASLEYFAQENQSLQGEMLLNTNKMPVVTTHFTQLLPSNGGVQLREVVMHNNTLEYDIISQIDFKSLGDLKELTLQLSPKELGEMSIKIIQNQGILAAEIKVENEKVKETVLHQLHQLEEQLQHEGIQISDVQVNINQKNEQTYMEKQKQKSSKRIQEILSQHIEDIGEQEAPINVTNSEVDYVV